MNKLLVFLAALGKFLEYALAQLRLKERREEHADAKERVEEIRRDPLGYFDRTFGGVSDSKAVPGDAVDADRAKDQQNHGG